MLKLRKLKTVWLVVLALVMVLALAVACTPNTPEGENPAGNTSGGNTTDPTKKDITGVTFSDATVPYDGEEHEITVSGTIPEGVTAIYTGNKGTNAGTYKATATLSGEGYNTLTLNATLTVNKAQITNNFTFNSLTVEYDGLPHAIQLVGNVPAGVSVEYYYNETKTDSVTAVGTYNVTAILSGENHETLTLSAKLTIIATEEMLYSVVYNGNVYFQNSLDGNKLYSATNSGNSLSKVSNDTATYFAKNSTNLYFYSGGLLSQTIKTLSSGKPSTVFNPGRATYLACDDSGNLYYAKANLVDVKGENGIYKVNITENDPTPVRLTTDKANYLAYYNGYIYYCNTSNGSKLYRISTNANEATGELLIDHKVSDIIVEDGDVYFTQHDTTNSAIYRFSISSRQSTQLCIDNGAYLTKVDDYIYYINKDLLTSNIFGKGIYKVSIDGAFLGLVGEKVLDAEDGNGYYSLASDGNNLYYYKRNDKHFYRYNITTAVETDLMRNFEPEEDTTFSMYPYAHLATYKGEVYYTNPLDSNSLYKYNLQTRQSFKVLADSISNVYFNGNYMYYSTYIVTNYALWRLDLTNNEAEAEKISSSRYENLIFDGDYIYAVRISVPGAHRNYIIRMDLDGQNETELYTDKNVHVTKLYLLDGTFHFTINPTVGYKYIYTHGINEAEKSATNVGVKSDNFVICNSRYYYFDHTENKLMSCSLTGTDVKTLVSNVDITDIYQYNGVVYYTSKSSQNTGVYAYNISTGSNTLLSTNVGHGFQMMDGKLYFINIALSYSLDYPSRNSGDGHLYCIDLANKTETKLA